MTRYLWMIDLAEAEELCPTMREKNKEEFNLDLDSKSLWFFVEHAGEDGEEHDEITVRDNPPPFESSDFKFRFDGERWFRSDGKGWRTASST